MEIVVVSDTNIFIDLFKLGLLNAFFNLPWEIHTTDFVINELEDPDQKASAETYINQNRLIVGTLSAEDLNAILLRRDASGTKVSFTDYSVCYYAKKYGYTLLTGDKPLRKIAESEGVPVHGILYLLDELIYYGILSPLSAAEALEHLNRINSRLPIDEVEARLKKWK